MIFGYCVCTHVVLGENGNDASRHQDDEYD